MKKNKIFLIVVVIVILILLVIGLFLFEKKKSENNKTTTTKIVNLSNTAEKLLTLFAKDQKIKNIIYGDIKVGEANIKFDEVTYYMLDDNEYESIKALSTDINSIYVKSTADILEKGLNKYNKVVEYDNKLYIQKNKKCDIKEYSSNLTLTSLTTKDIRVNYFEKEYELFIEKGVYKIMFSPYNCE